MIEMPNCIGCGTTIQTEDKTAVGYAPPSSLEKDVVICQRCFRLKNYNEIQPVSLTDDDFLRILNGLGTQQGLIVKIVDIFDFNGSWLPGLHRFVGKNPVLLIANKADLLPKSVKPKKVINWLKREAKALGLQPVDVLLVSAHKGKGMAEAMEAIDAYRKGQNVYVVGCTNVGKSTFINRIIKQATGEGEVITTSHFPGTTLDMIDIPLDDGSALYDTPGIINHHQMAHHIDSSELKYIMPKKKLSRKSTNKMLGKPCLLVHWRDLILFRETVLPLQSMWQMIYQFIVQSLRRQMRYMKNIKENYWHPQLRNLSTSCRHWFVMNFPSKKRKQILYSLG